MSEMNERVRKLIDVFACGDGGVALIKVRAALLDLEKKADDGDIYAKQLVSITNQFVNLVDILRYTTITDK